MLPHLHFVGQLCQDHNTALVVEDKMWDWMEHDCRKLLTTVSALEHFNHETEHIFTVSIEDEVTHDTVFQFNERELGLF